MNNRIKKRLQYEIRKLGAEKIRLTEEISEKSDKLAVLDIKLKSLQETLNREFPNDL